MDNSPVIECNLGDGEMRRLYLGAREIKLFETEIGMGWRSFYLAMASGDVRLDHVHRALRLALIGGGENPDNVKQIIDYCANPPTPLKWSFMAVAACMEAVWNGYPDSKPKKAGKPATTEDLDRIMELFEANFARGGYTVNLEGMSMSQVASLHERLFGDNKPGAPDLDTFQKIKDSAKSQSKGKS